MDTVREEGGRRLDLIVLKGHYRGGRSFGKGYIKGGVTGFEYWIPSLGLVTIKV